MKKAALQNLGCKVNAYETEGMEQMLMKDGYEIVEFHEKADVYVINTCSVTNIADRKSRQMIHRARKINPEAVVIAAGCYVQTSQEQAIADESINIILGNNKKVELIEQLHAFLQDREKKEELLIIADENTFEDIHIQNSMEHTRAFVKVQDGCNQFCSYCIIPYARGRVRSRNCKDVIQEVTLLANKGFQEVVLTGIHLSSYGVDCGDSLLNLIQNIAKVEGINRIRLGSLEPKIITEEFVKALVAIPEICPHFHLSLQSGSDTTLKRMRRTYTTNEYLEGCELLRKYFQHPALTTDVIVGFPQETEDEFIQTKEFLKKINFYEVHLFKYSKRQGTLAAKMDGQIQEIEKTRRSSSLAKLVKQDKKKFMDFYLDLSVEGLMEEKITIDDEEFFVGYTKEYVKVAVKADRDYLNLIFEGQVIGYLTQDILLLQ